MAKGYWIARVSVHDAERYKDYVAAGAEAFQKFGARFLVRGGHHQAMEGTARPRNVVIEFPSFQAAVDCWNSSEYARARAIRQSVSDGELVIVEGAEP